MGKFLKAKVDVPPALVAARGCGGVTPWTQRPNASGYGPLWKTVFQVARVGGGLRPAAIM